MSSVSTRPSCAAASMTCGSFDARPVPCSSWNDSTTRLACRARMPETMGHAAACNSQPPSAPRMQSAYRTIPIRIADNSWQAFSRALYPCRQPPGAARTDRIGAATTSACERIPGLEPGPRPRQGRALTAELHPQRAPPRANPGPPAVRTRGRSRATAASCPPWIRTTIVAFRVRCPADWTNGHRVVLFPHSGRRQGVRGSNSVLRIKGPVHHQPCLRRQKIERAVPVSRTPMAVLEAGIFAVRRIGRPGAALPVELRPYGKMKNRPSGFPAGGSR